MKIFNTTNKDAIFYTDEREASSDAQAPVEAPEQISELERAQNALKKANKAIQAGKPEEEAKELSAYEWYTELVKCNPREAGKYWRANKQAIYACIPSK